MATVLTIDGNSIDRIALGVSLGGVDLYGKGVIPSLRFSVQGGALADFPNWNNKAVTLTEGGVLIFAGRTGMGVTSHDPGQYGWVREWVAYGLIRDALRVAVTDPNTTTDVIVFNTSFEDGPEYLPSRAGRSCGQIAAAVLEWHAPALALKGVGNFTSTGSGAQASATISGGIVTAVSIDDGGSGYSTAPVVLFSGGGGSGATGTASVSAGVVTGITVTDGGSGYLSPPIPVLSTLPASTLADLDLMPIVPPQRFTVSGESVLQSLESTIQTYYPNAFMHIEPGGDIRFLDPRTYTADITLELDGSDARVPKPHLTRDWSGCFSNVEVLGSPQVQGWFFDLVPPPGSSEPNGGLEEDFAHDGLTSDQAKTAFRVSDWNEPGQSYGQALATAAIGSGAVTTITVGNQGYGYTGTPSISITGGGGSGATATATLTGDKVTSIAVTNGGSGYTTVPTVTLTAPGVGQSVIGTCTMANTTTVTITPSDPRVQWPANYWDQSDSGHRGYLMLTDDTLTGISQRHAARIIANDALTPGGTCDLTIDNPAPGTTFTAFQLYGQGGGGGLVWRKYKISDHDIARRIQQRFPYPVAYRSGVGAATLVTEACATVFRNGQQLSAQVVQIDPDAGTVVLGKPTALMFSNAVPPQILAPDNVQVFLPVALSGNRAVWPPDALGVPQFAGTSYDEEGITDVKPVRCLEWRDTSNLVNMTLWAKELHGSLCDTVLEGNCEYLGLLADALVPGHAVNIPADGYTTGWESIDLPIARCSLQYNEGRGGTHFVTAMMLSNRRALYSGVAFVRPAPTGRPIGMSGGFFSATPLISVGGGALMAQGGFGESPIANAAAGNSALNMAGNSALNLSGNSGFAPQFEIPDMGGFIPNAPSPAPPPRSLASPSKGTPDAKPSAPKKSLPNTAFKAKPVKPGFGKPKAISPQEQRRVAALGDPKKRFELELEAARSGVPLPENPKPTPSRPRPSPPPRMARRPKPNRPPRKPLENTALVMPKDPERRKDIAALGDPQKRYELDLERAKRIGTDEPESTDEE